MSAAPDGGAAPSIGLATATALVVGNMVGSGLFLLPSSLAPFGAASALGWIISTIGALLLAAVFARLGQLRPALSGGPYAFAHAAFGDGIGFLVAWCYWISIWSAVPAIAIAFTGYAGSLVPALTATPLRAAGCSVLVLWLCTVFNISGLRTAGGVQLVTTLVKVGALVAFAIVGLAWFGGDANAAPRPFNPSGQSLLGVAMTTSALTLWAFLGLESATVPAGAVRDPARTVPRATLVGTAIAIVVTIGACSAVMRLVPPESLATSGAPFVDAVRLLLGDAAGRVVALVAAITCLGTLNGWVMMLGQLPLAVARDGLFPPLFAQQDANGTPRSGLLFGAVLSSVLVGANYSASLVHLFTWAILLSTAASLLPFLICAAALMRIERGRPWMLAVAAFALVYAAYALVGTGAEALTWGAALLAAGLPLYLWQRRRQ
ncbi:amino acid permease [Tahibacter soli]|uniref:Arginine/agmatine antiporter n=1 Tax=Tahibacter soli TaxID=2983605 RepID=A0A9X3YGX2_9GAMM|nr:amino acid permease [Tahibacter soli]MDC8012007.1 amino acid permease [Tahibacter soli]